MFFLFKYNFVKFDGVDKESNTFELIYAVFKNIKR